MEYRILTFKSLSKNLQVIDLGDQAYGEWIIYEDDIPRFHVNCFRNNSKSDLLIKNLLQKEKLSIEQLLAKINLANNRKLILTKRPLVEIEISSSLKEMNLKPLPIELIPKSLK